MLTLHCVVHTMTLPMSVKSLYFTCIFTIVDKHAHMHPDPHTHIHIYTNLHTRAGSHGVHTSCVSHRCKTYRWITCRYPVMLTLDCVVHTMTLPMSVKSLYFTCIFTIVDKHAHMHPDTHTHIHIYIQTYTHWQVHTEFTLRAFGTVSRPLVESHVENQFCLL